MYIQDVYKGMVRFQKFITDYILQLEGAPPPHLHRNVQELLNRVLQLRWIGSAANGDNHIYILYEKNSIIVCGCVSCDPGCTH
jgi:hypothetical protein